MFRGQLENCMWYKLDKFIHLRMYSDTYHDKSKHGSLTHSCEDLTSSIISTLIQIFIILDNGTFPVHSK